MTPKTSDKREVRDIVESIELRAAADGSKSPGTLVGYAALFNRLSLDLGYFREQIAPGAFASALGRCDVRALFNHDPSCVLGRTSAGTLRLVEDEIGLRMECDLPDTQLGRDTAESIRRRDIQGQSFAFTISKEEWDWKSDPPLRTLVEADELYDVGPVTYPAYEETSVALRSFQTQQAKESAPAIPSPHIAIAAQRDAARVRLLDVF
jgi:HK97 family phage prohead protease